MLLLLPLLLLPLPSSCSCPSGWLSLPPYGCFLIDTTNYRDFYMTLDFCKAEGGHMVEFLTWDAEKALHAQVRGMSGF